VFVHLVYYDYEMIIHKPNLKVLRSPPNNAATSQVSANSEKKSGKKDPKKNSAAEVQSQSRMFFGTATSINSIFFGSMFSLLYMSMCIFGFMPMLRHLIRHRVRSAYYGFSILGSLVLANLIFNLNGLYGLLYLSLILFVSFLSPLIFIYAYQFKNDIRGPWDCPQIKQYHSL
jgi:sorbitol-specific phosphotransferase system component IIBC